MNILHHLYSNVFRLISQLHLNLIYLTLFTLIYPDQSILSGQYANEVKLLNSCIVNNTHN